MIIKIKNLRFSTMLGVYEWEKSFAREIIVNVEMKIADEKSLQSDDLKDSVDYDQIISLIKETCRSRHFNLIETMAGEVMEKILQNKQIAFCKLEIEKVAISDNCNASIVLESVSKPIMPRFSTNFGLFFYKIFCRILDTAAKFCKKVAQNF